MPMENVMTENRIKPVTGIECANYEEGYCFLTGLPCCTIDSDASVRHLKQAECPYYREFVVISAEAYDRICNLEELAEKELWNDEYDGLTTPKEPVHHWRQCENCGSYFEMWGKRKYCHTCEIEMGLCPPDPPADSPEEETERTPAFTIALQESPFDYFEYYGEEEGE